MVHVHRYWDGVVVLPECLGLGLQWQVNFCELASVAQWNAHPTCDHEVAGSVPH